MRQLNVKKEDILNKIPVFLAKTYRIIDNPEYAEAISWSEDGQSFIIKDIARLTNDIFPRHFKHSNYLSFVRQLNFYGFRKKSDQEGPGHTFSHAFFRREDVDLLLEMKRKAVANEQSNSGAVVVAGSREQKLQKELQILKRQHEQLQSMMEILVEQNKSITHQNKVFANMMAQMKDKYRKKLEALMLLFLFGKKPQGNNREFIFPAHFEQMVEAFQQGQNGNPMLMAPSKGRKRHPKLMITGASPRFQQDPDQSDHPDEEESKMELEMHRVPSERSVQLNGLDMDLAPPSPASSVPYSAISRGNMRRLDDDSWLNCLNRNQSECSEFELEQHDE